MLLLHLTPLLLVGGLMADADLSSGPSPNDPTPALKAYAVAGAPKDQEVDYAKIRKDQATVFVFIETSRWNRSMFRFLKALEERLGESDQVVAIWLTSDEVESKNYLTKIAGYFQKTALGVAAVQNEVPKDWGINPDAGLTAVAAKKGKVVQSWGYRVPNEADAKDVANALK
jgi:hypothetical protein